MTFIAGGCGIYIITDLIMVTIGLVLVVLMALNAGEYTIIATFEGSNSYYSSYAETAIGVEEGASPGGSIEPEPTEPTAAPFITTEMAIIIAAVLIAIGLVAGFFIIKKRK